jgi:hypothetical protein
MPTSPNVSLPGRPLGPPTPAVSTGPRTGAGKARASQTARRRPLQPRDRARIVALVADAIIAAHQPVNSQERLAAIEASLFSNCLNFAMYTPEDANILQAPERTQFQPTVDRNRALPTPTASAASIVSPKSSPPFCVSKPRPSVSTAAPSTISTASRASATSSSPKIARQNEPIVEPLDNPQYEQKTTGSDSGELSSQPKRTQKRTHAPMPILQ